MDCGACPNTTTGTSITCVYTQSDVSIDANHMCMFAVQTEICGYLLGEKSDYVMVHLNNDGKTIRLVHDVQVNCHQIM